MSTIRVTDSPYGEHFPVYGANAPTEREEDRVHAKMIRVRCWDRNVRNGWVPLGCGQKRMIRSLDWLDTHDA